MDDPFFHTVAEIGYGDHVCCLYETEGQHQAQIAPFLRLGLVRGEKILYIEPPGTAQGGTTSREVLDALRGDGLDIDAHLARGQLTFLQDEKRFTREGVFDPERMISLLESETDRALAERYPALRVIGEMRWVLEGLPDSRTLVDFETLLNEFLPRNRCLGLFLYDQRHFPAEILLQVLRTHPIAIIGTEVYDNLYYVPPAELREAPQTTELLYWVRNLAERRATEDVCHILIEHFLQGLAIMQGDRVIFANQTIAEMLGLTVEELQSLTPEGLLEFVHPEHRSILWERYRQRLAGKDVPQRGEFRLVRRDGTQLWIELRADLIQFQGKPAIQATFVDTTERKEAEEAYRTLVERSLQGLVIFQEGRIAYANPAIADMIGCAPEDLQDVSWQGVDAFLHPQHQDEVRDRHARRLRGEGVRDHYELAATRRDGSPLWLEVHSSLTEYRGKPAVQALFIDITERKAAEEALRQSEERYRSLVQKSKDAIFRVGVDGQIGFVSPAARDIFGYDPEEFVSDRTLVARIVHPDCREQLEETWQRFLKKGSLAEEAVEWTCIHKDGRTVHAETLFTSLYDESGQVIGFQAIARDITERKRAEADQKRAMAEILGASQALKESEEIYRALIQTSPDSVTVTDLEGRITYVSQRALELHGCETPEGLIGRNAYELLAPEDRERAAQNLQRTMREGVIRNVSYTFLRKDGSRFAGELNAAIVPGGDGQPKAFIATVRDVTRRQRFERELEERRVYLEGVLAAAPDAIVSLDANHCVVEWNPGAERLFGYAREEVIGESLDPLITNPDTLEQAVGFTQQVLSRQEVLPVEVLRYRKDGTPVQVIVAGSPILVEGELIGVVAVYTDVTERRRAQEEKERIVAQLSRAQRMEALGRLAGGIAHDFNNLLTTITGFGELLLNRLEEHDPLRGDLEEILKAGERASSLTRQLLSFSRGQVLEPQVSNLNAVASEMETMLRRLLGEDIHLVTSLEPELAYTHADVGQIEQVIVNLAVNARDAMPDGGRLTVKTENVLLDETRCREIPDSRPGSFVRLSVEDTGVGMDHAILQHVFEPFFTTKESGEGTGLGLTVVYGIVQQHGGWINAYSELGKGSTFVVYLPSFGMVREEDAEETEPTHELMGRGEHILVVEDEAGVREFALRALSENGYVVSAAVNAREALEMFSSEPAGFDLVFCDVILPDKKGLDLIGEMLSHNLNVGVLMSSGYTREKAQWSLIREEGYSFLAKPFAVTDLLRAVRQALDSR